MTERNTPGHKMTVSDVFNSQFFTLGLSDAIHGKPWREIYRPGGYSIKSGTGLSYERGRQLGVLIKDKMPMPKGIALQLFRNAIARGDILP